MKRYVVTFSADISGLKLIKAKSKKKARKKVAKWLANNYVRVSLRSK